MATSISTGVLSANTLIATGRNRINAVTVFTDGTNAGTVDLYDNTTNSGKIGVKARALGTALATHYIFENPVLFENGIYAAVTGTGATYIVYFAG